MSTIVTIAAGDQISNSRTDINSNFSNLNTDKIETSVLDTDTTLSANSDAKIPSQKAVKAYVDAGGNVNASETARGIVEEATDAEVTAGTATGGTGAKLVLTPAKLQTYLAATYQPIMVFKSGLTTKNMADANTTQTIAHGLGRTPKRVTFHATYASGASDSGVMHGFYDATSQNCAGLMFDEGGSSAAADASYTNTTALKISEDATLTKYVVGTVSVDATNISIAWVKTSTPAGTWNILWSAE